MVVACNDIGAKWPQVDFWVSLHPDKFARWIDERRRNGFSIDGIRFVTHRAHRNRYEIVKDWGGSSGLLAVRTALERGASHVIACGIPMHLAPHYFDAKPWKFSGHHHRGWTNNLPELKNRVRSMSGWTCKLLGPPTREWLNEGRKVMIEFKALSDFTHERAGQASWHYIGGMTYKVREGNSELAAALDEWIKQGKAEILKEPASASRVAGQAFVTGPDTPPAAEPPTNPEPPRPVARPMRRR